MQHRSPGQKPRPVPRVYTRKHGTAAAWPRRQQPQRTAVGPGSFHGRSTQLRPNELLSGIGVAVRPAAGFSPTLPEPHACALPRAGHAVCLHACALPEQRVFLGHAALLGAAANNSVTRARLRCLLSVRRSATCGDSALPKFASVLQCSQHLLPLLTCCLLTRVHTHVHSSARFHPQSRLMQTFASEDPRALGRARPDAGHR